MSTLYQKSDTRQVEACARKTHTCQHCGDHLPQRQRGRPKQYCSDKCRKASERDISASRGQSGVRYRTDRVGPLTRR
jgi:hypothetical protein